MSNNSLNASRWAPAASRNQSYNHHQPKFTTSSTTQSRSISPLRKASPTKQLQPPQLTKLQKQFQHKSQTYHKFTKLFRRLKWKAKALLFCHHHTLEQIHNHHHHHHHPNNSNNNDNPLTNPISATEAKTMFKIDFFEFYVLLERLLVHLLEIFDITVSAIHARDIQTLESDGSRLHHNSNNDTSTPSPSPSNSNPIPNSSSLVGDTQIFHGPQSTHSFHANVLSALDQPTNPFHSILGTGIVRDYLGIAKEFRNRWKDVDDKFVVATTTITTNTDNTKLLNSNPNEGDGEVDHNETLQGSRYERMTEDLKLEEMLAAILGAIERCVGLVDGEVDRVRGLVGREIDDHHNVGNNVDGGMTTTTKSVMMSLMEVDMLVDDFDTGDGDRGVDGHQYQGQNYQRSHDHNQQRQNEVPWEAMPDAMEWD